MRDSQKNFIIANRKSTTRFPSRHRWTLCITPMSPKGWLKTRIFTFDIAFHSYPRGASSARVIAKIVSVCVCVCVCVTRWYCIKTAKRRTTKTTLCDSPGTLAFWTPKFVGGRAPFLLKFALKVTHPPFKQHNFDQHPLIAPQPWEMAKKVQLALIGSRPRAFQRAIDEACTLSLTPPKGGTKRDFAIFYPRGATLRG